MNLNELYLAVYKITDVLPVSIESLVSLFDMDLNKKAILSGNVSSQIEKLDNGKFKISCNKSDHYFKQRFSIAFELSRILLYYDGIVTFRNATSYEFYYEKKQDNQRNEKIVSNRLAAIFLMPKKFLHNYIGKTLDDITLKNLATKFQVSPLALKLRLDILKKNAKNCKFVMCVNSRTKED